MDGEGTGLVRGRPRWYERLRYEDAPFPAWRVDRWPAYLLKFAMGGRWAPRGVSRHFLRVRSLCGAERLPPADLVLAAAGDILWMRRGWEDFIGPGADRALRAEVVFGNLETPVVPGRPVRERVPERLRLNAPPALLETLARHGFRALSVVNNHSLDQGPEGWRRTSAEVRRRGMVPVGPAGWETLEVKGLRVAFLAFTTFFNFSRRREGARAPAVGPRGENAAPLLAAVARAAERHHLVVVSAHWGYEYEYLPAPWQVRLARRLAGAGADVIIGHHPHVLQPAEFIPVPGGNGRTCAVCYSLGNFVSAMHTIPYRVGAVARVGLRLEGERVRPAWLELVPTLVQVRRGLRTRVVGLEEAAAAGLPRRSIARARALVSAQTPLRLAPPIP